MPTPSPSLLVRTPSPSLLAKYLGVKILEPQILRDLANHKDLGHLMSLSYLRLIQQLLIRCFTHFCYTLELVPGLVQDFTLLFFLSDFFPFFPSTFLYVSTVCKVLRRIESITLLYILGPSSHQSKNTLACTIRTCMGENFSRNTIYFHFEFTCCYFHLKQKCNNLKHKLEEKCT